jgi:hypothetical protein
VQSASVHNTQESQLPVIIGEDSSHWECPQRSGSMDAKGGSHDSCLYESGPQYGQKDHGLISDRYQSQLSFFHVSC